MTASSFERNLEEAYQRLEALALRAGTGSEDYDVRGAMQEVSIALEELSVAMEKMREQNEQLIAARTALDSERHRYQNLFEFAPEGYLVTDARGVIQEANRHAAGLLGVAQTFLPGKPLSHFVAEADRPAFRLLVQRLETEAVREVELHLEPRQGKGFPATVWVAAVRDALGALIGLRWLIRDITELKETQRRALQAERLAAIGQMMAGLAHESRNALQRSKACLAMLALEVQDRPAALDLVARARKAQDDLHHLFEEVRQYAAPLRLQRQTCDLSDILHQAWEHLAVEREGREACLEESGDANCRCSVDRLALEQVYRNIFENALHASPGKAEITVAYSDAEIDGRPAVQVGVRDNGTGMSRETRQLLFEPFFTTKTHGTGLGMAIAKRIVEAHGGRITVGETANPGAEIVIILPRAES